MISIPVSFLLAAVFLSLGIAALNWRSLPPVARGLFVWLFGLLTLEAALVGARFAFGVVELLTVQRVLPVWIAPSVYLAFVSLTVSGERTRQLVALNFGAAAIVTVAMHLPVPVAGYVDGLIGASYAVYAFALARLWSQGPDVFCQAPTNKSGLLRNLLGFSILIMLATLLIDAFVAYLFAQQSEVAAALAISLASLFFLVLAVGAAFGVLGARFGRSRAKVEESVGNDAQRAEIVDSARKVLVDQEFFRDPSLTLTRLARRVGVPDRDLSRAVNAVEGVNVSQFVNLVRLAEAERLLVTTDEPVGRIQERAGFLTRSNFYREFQKAYGEAPGAYRKNAQSSL
ncbi:helix-turn-helix transcriptional regulator [Roseibium aggregatum]|uniref:helix-turn-helix transcriptional regulator n=1 Tax=Roseibium aggregatum TaxID=187304 RepID=UPI001E5001E2|nr:AraC family transcriptional regulator [Roseibium aggregatum]UES51478.1 helix-turn-helix domain-containing protein [Roseibium aggregatum]